MRVLIVGCGAVGQVFGLYLQNAGVEVGFYTRGDSTDSLNQARNRGGLNLYQICKPRRKEPIIHRLVDYQVVTDIEGSQRFKPDQIWFATPSTVFYSEWFKKFLDEVPSKRVVCFAPEGKRPEFMSYAVDKKRWVFGGVTFISWQRDQKSGGAPSKGVDFWIPPFAEIPLVGEKEACDEVEEVLLAGGIKAMVRGENFLNLQAAITALMTAFVAGFELAGWSFGAYRRSPWLKFAANGAREACSSQISEAGFFYEALFGIITNRAIFFLSTFLLPILTPFNLENYLRFHYLKTRDQTLKLLDVFIQDGENQGLPVGKIQLLRQGLLGSD